MTDTTPARKPLPAHVRRNLDATIAWCDKLERLLGLGKPGIKQARKHVRSMAEGLKLEMLLDDAAKGIPEAKS